jgi:nitrite reductase/ring-hydroxylating ferredoxin subunit
MTLLNIDWRTLPNAPLPGSRLCRLQDLAEDMPQEFHVMPQSGATTPFRILAYRQANTVHAYVNQCPHQWLPMNRSDGSFLMWSSHELMCAQHSAVFDLANAGICSMGPCQGSNLLRVPLTIVGDELLIGGVHSELT